MAAFTRSFLVGWDLTARFPLGLSEKESSTAVVSDQVPCFDCMLGRRGSGLGSVGGFFAFSCLRGGLDVGVGFGLFGVGFGLAGFVGVGFVVASFVVAGFAVAGFVVAGFAVATFGSFFCALADFVGAF